ncbi:uncharacterized protein METZ01_LOCUS318989, partial [marine metagenome]
MLAVNLAGERYYVDITRPDDSGDGLSWAEAKKNLRTANALAVEGDEIWVAAGVYYPDEGVGSSNNNKSQKFLIQNSIKVYGGFEGNEAEISDREKRDKDGDGIVQPWEFEHVSILSGDMGQDDVNDDMNNIVEDVLSHIKGINSEKLVEIVVPVPGEVVLDGLVFTGASHYSGINSTSNAQIDSCIIIGNKNRSSGGGITTSNSNSATIKITGSLITRNWAESYGGGVHIYQTPNAILKNVTISLNKTGRSGNGGGLNVRDSNTELINCVISGNETTSSGGGIYYYSGSSSSVLKNCLISGNTSGGTGGGIFNASSGGLELYNCTIVSNKSTAGD